MHYAVAKRNRIAIQDAQRRAHPSLSVSGALSLFPTSPPRASRELTRLVFELPVWTEYMEAYAKSIDKYTEMLESDKSWFHKSTYFSVTRDCYEAQAPWRKVDEKVVWAPAFDEYKVLKQLVEYEYRLETLKRSRSFYIELKWEQFRHFEQLHKQQDEENRERRIITII